MQPGDGIDARSFRRIIHRLCYRLCGWLICLRNVLTEWDDKGIIEHIQVKVDKTLVDVYFAEASSYAGGAIRGILYNYIENGARSSIDDPKVCDYCLRAIKWRAMLVFVQKRQEAGIEPQYEYVILSHPQPEKAYFIYDMGLIDERKLFETRDLVERAVRDVIAETGIEPENIIFLVLRDDPVPIASGDRRDEYDKILSAQVQPEPLKPTISFDSYPEAFREKLLRLLSSKANGRPLFRNVVLLGPAGTGKSTLARALLYKLNYRKYIQLSPEKYLYWYVGSSERTLARILARAKREKIPIVIDDGEHIGSRAILYRDHADYMNARLVTLLLRYFEEAEHHNVIAINYAHALDSALLRHGRGDVLILMLYPDMETRKLLLRNIAGRLGVKIPERDLERLAEMLEYASIAELESAVKYYMLGGIKEVEESIYIDVDERRREEMAYLIAAARISAPKICFPPSKNCKTELNRILSKVRRRHTVKMQPTSSKDVVSTTDSGRQNPPYIA